MIPTLSGYTFRPIAIASTPEEVEYFVTQEASLAQFTRIVIEVPLDPSEDISSIAQQVQAACVENSVPYWPEYPNTYTFIEDNTLYIAYMRPSGDVSPSIAWLPILLIVAIIAPIIMLIAIPGLMELINGIIMIAIMYLMFSMMRPMLETGPKAAAVPSEPRLPIEQRISRRIESIAESIERTERAFERSKSAGVAAISSVVSDITGVARAVKGAPSTAMSGYQKAKAAGKLDTLDDRLVKYKEHLTPSQLRDLEEEQRIVDELRAMYD